MTGKEREGHMLAACAGERVIGRKKGEKPFRDVPAATLTRKSNKEKRGKDEAAFGD